MEYIYEIERKELPEEKINRLLRWLKRKNIEYVKTDEKIIIKHDDYYFIYRFDKFIEALKAGFKFDESTKILTEDWELLSIDVKKAAEKKINHMLRILSRIIGEEGKVIRKVQELTKSRIIVKDRYVYILGDRISVQSAFETIRKIVLGTPHSRAFDFAIGFRRHLKNKEKEARQYLNL